MTVTRNKKQSKVVINFSKQKAWCPPTTGAKVKRSEKLLHKSKSSLKLYKEAYNEWQHLDSEVKKDYLMRRIGEKEVVAFLEQVHFHYSSFSYT